RTSRRRSRKATKSASSRRSPGEGEAAVPARKPLVRSVGPQRGAHGAPYSKRCWFTFPTRDQVEQPIIWQMSRKFPDVMFDIRQASVQNEIGIMAVLLTGEPDEVQGAIDFLRSSGVMVEPIEKSVVEG